MPKTLVRWVGGRSNEKHIEFNLVTHASAALNDEETLEAESAEDGSIVPIGVLGLSIQELLTQLRTRSAGTITQWRVDPSVGFIWYDEAFEVGGVRTSRRQESQDIALLMYGQVICEALAVTLSTLLEMSIAVTPQRGRPLVQAEI